MNQWFLMGKRGERLSFQYMHAETKRERDHCDGVGCIDSRSCIILNILPPLRVLLRSRLLTSCAGHDDGRCVAVLHVTVKMWLVRVRSMNSPGFWLFAYSTRIKGGDSPTCRYHGITVVLPASAGRTWPHLILRTGIRNIYKNYSTHIYFSIF